MLSTTSDDCVVSLESLITSGGDERTELNAPDFTNKYGLNPVRYEGLLNRGSCTTSPLNAFSESVVKTLINETLPQLGYAAIREEHTARLKNLLNYEGQDAFDVFWAPSGSDLVYIPLLFASLLYPGRRIVHMLTCPEELGSGTQIGARGEYFMEVNQFGKKLPQHELIDPNLDIEMVHYAARSKEGNINNHQQDLLQTIKDNPDAAKIGSLVIGSKSGIENNIDVLDLVDDDMLWVVDLCQFRNSKRLIHKLLDRNCMIMLTGSKFYQAPPFCGAMLLPKKLTERVVHCPVNMDLKPYGDLFSTYDVPPCFNKLQGMLPREENIGLLARWECGLTEMEAFDCIPKQERKKLVQDWNDLVCSEIQARSDFFELMPNQEMTNNSIISFRVKKEGNYINNGDLRRFFDELVSERYPDTFEGPYDRITIGQPVNYGDRSFIRLALGAHDIRMMLQKDHPFINEVRVLDLIQRKLATWS